MKVGILKEIKIEESRVCMTPAGVEIMVQNGHQILVERSAGVGSGFDDEEYLAVGAKIADGSAEVYAWSEMIMHVKEPQPQEYEMIREGQIIFTYFHFAASEELTRAMIARKAVCIAYETIRDDDGTLPLLTPMSEVAGRMAVQEAAKYVERAQGGRGLLLGGVPGVDPGTVLVLGGGVVGTHAALMACGLGAKVYLLDTSLSRLRYLSEIMPKNCIALMSSPAKIRELVAQADVVIGAVLLHGAKAPKLITRAMLGTMKPGAVIVDVAIDQGGCFETSKATTHKEPIYEVDGIIHYCVANMPGAVPLTSTMALTNATLPFAVTLANKGWKKSARESMAMKEGINIVEGKVTCRGVAEAFEMPCASVDNIIA
jgi:alanine dehydrogenase